LLLLDTAQQATIKFDDDMNPASFGVADLEVRPQSLPTAPATLPTNVSYDIATKTATFTFSPPLPDGIYTAQLLASSVTDTDGTALVSASSFDFFILAGDANHDGSVNTIDFTELAANFNHAGATFGQGDFNYDGVVNALDFNILATKFGTDLAPPAGAAPLAQSVPPAMPPPGNLFASQPIWPGIDALADVDPLGKGPP
jgi:hypothetical protein